MRIPQVRAALIEVAEVLDRDLPACWAADRIRELVGELYRRPYIRKAPVKHAPLTVYEIAEARRLATAYPNMHEQDIAVMLNTNSGRISEALHGKRT